MQNGVEFNQKSKSGICILQCVDGRVGLELEDQKEEKRCSAEVGCDLPAAHCGLNYTATHLDGILLILCLQLC